MGYIKCSNRNRACGTEGAQKLPSRKALSGKLKGQVSGYVKLQIKEGISGREGVLSQTWQCADDS